MVEINPTLDQGPVYDQKIAIENVKTCFLLQALWQQKSMNRKKMNCEVFFQF